MAPKDVRVAHHREETVIVVVRKVGMEINLAGQKVRHRHAANLTVEVARKAGIWIGLVAQKVHLHEAMTIDVARRTNATIVVAEAQADLRT